MGEGARVVRRISAVARPLCLRPTSILRHRCHAAGDENQKTSPATKILHIHAFRHPHKMQLDRESVDDRFELVEPRPHQHHDIPSVFHLPRLHGHDLFEISVDELQSLYTSGAFSAEDYTQFCLNRVQAVNPFLEAIIETNPDALAVARSLDDERANGAVRGPLHGVPVLVKDVGRNICPSISPQNRRPQRPAVSPACHLSSPTILACKLPNSLR